MKKRNQHIQWLQFIVIVSGICTLLSSGAALVVVTAAVLIRDLAPSQQIAYIRAVRSAADVYVIDVNHWLSLNLTDTPANAPSVRRALLYDPENVMVWSPDGETIAYLSRYGTFSLNVVDLHRQLLTLIPTGELISGLAWSPDGITLGYSAWKRESSTNPSIDVYAYYQKQPASPSSTGTGITFVPDPLPLINTLNDDRQLAWSPDGTRLAFISGAALYVMSLTDQTPIRLTSLDLLPVMFDWSPDGTQIALAANYLKPPVIYTDLYLIEPATGKSTALGIRNPSGTLYDVAWSPDGSQLAFVSNHLENRLALYVWNLHDLYPRILTDRTFDSIAEPDWSPDNHQLVFVGFTTSRLTDLYIINSDGSGLWRLPGTSDYVWSPRWRP